jgi:AAHS family 3-hydroxyphenylpropionic acid transporter
VIIALCFAVAMLEGYDIQAVGVAAPKMAPALHLSHAQTGWVFSASMVGLVIGAMFGGWLADRVGRKPVLICSVLAFGLCSAATVFVIGDETLLAARFVTGLGLGGAMPNLIAIAAEISRPGRRGGTASLMFCGMPLGGAVAAALAGWALGAYGWRLIFLVGGLAPIALLPLLVLFLPETRPVVAGDPGDRRALATLFGQGRAPATLLLWTSFVLTLVVLYLLLNWLPTLALTKGLTPRQAPQVALAFNLTSIVGAMMLGMLVDRLGVRIPLTLTYAGLVAVMIVLAGASGYAAVMVFSGLAGFLVIGAQYALYGVAPAYYPVAGRATGAGAAVAVGRLGSIAGPLVAGQLLAGGATAGKVVATMAPVALVAGVAVLLLTFVGRHES